MFKYCVSITLRRFGDFGDVGKNIPLIFPLYYESENLRDFNDWLYHHICNTNNNDEIISILIEVVNK